MGLTDSAKRAAGAVGGHRIETKPTGRRVRVEHEGEVLADTTHAIELHETGHPVRFYLPREDVRMNLLQPSPTTSHCPFKGDASYFSAPGVKDAFWTYDQPNDDRADITGLLAPWPGRVEVTAE